MLISCPKCNSVYNISETRVPGGGKKFKCAECGQIWKVFPQDIQSIEPESKKNDYDVEENNDINVMFSRLSHNTKNLFSGENAIDTAKKQHFYHSFISVYTVVSFLLALAVILAVYLLYQNRYNIVSDIPAMEKVYARFNVESVYSGNNLIFRNVRIREIGYGNKNSVEISGRLHNSGNMTVKTLPVKVSFIDENGNTESEITDLLPPQRLIPGASTLFRIVADNPSAEIRKVKLSLEDINQD